jgi:predicted RNA-binding protein with PUA-like domain
MQMWLSTGTVENWETAISGNIWGVVEGLKHYWEKLNKGDLLFFYAKAPIKGIVGVARIENKFKQDKPLWAKELKENRVIWPYRYDFKVEFVLPRSEWETGQISVSDLKVGIQAGLNPIKDKQSTELLLQRTDQTWNTNLTSILEEVPAEPTIKPKVSLHDEIKERLIELGKIENYITEKEYVIPDLGERLDVVWRRVAGSVPTYVFEVQIGGSLHQALAKLKHAYDIWNSNIFIVSGEKDLQKISQLTSGTFHEIQDLLHIITVDKFDKMYELQIEDNRLKKEIGLR